MSKEEKKEVVYSFSKLDWSCLYAWHRKYNLKEYEPLSNAWSTGGSFCHKLMEDVAKEAITTSSAAEMFNDNWFDVVSDPPFPDFPRPLDTHYYWKIKPFFERERYWKGEIASVEEHLEFELPNGKRFQGYVDLTICDENGKNPILVDYKISKPFEGKKLKEKQRQLLLYCEGHRQKHGELPKKAAFYFFQDASATIVIDVTEELVQEALSWAMTRINIIEKLQLATSKLGVVGAWMPDFNKLEEKGKRNMYCKSLCGFRENCKFCQGDYFINKDILDNIE